MPTLAADALPWIMGVCIVCVVVLLLIVVAPWRQVRGEPPLDEDVETRLLLGEDPDEIARELGDDGPEERPPVSELRPEDHSGG